TSTIGRSMRTSENILSLLCVRTVEPAGGPPSSAHAFALLRPRPYAPPRPSYGGKPHHRPQRASALARRARARRGGAPAARGVALRARRAPPARLARGPRVLRELRAARPVVWRERARGALGDPRASAARG